jgi:hypothetical protein
MTLRLPEFRSIRALFVACRRWGCAARGFRLRQRLAAGAAPKASNLRMTQDPRNDLPQPHRLLALRALRRNNRVRHAAPVAEARGGFNSGKVRSGLTSGRHLINHPVHPRVRPAARPPKSACAAPRPPFRLGVFEIVFLLECELVHVDSLTGGHWETRRETWGPEPGRIQRGWDCLGVPQAACLASSSANSLSSIARLTGSVSDFSRCSKRSTFRRSTKCSTGVSFGSEQAKAWPCA